MRHKSVDTRLGSRKPWGRPPGLRPTSPSASVTLLQPAKAGRVLRLGP